MVDGMDKCTIGALAVQRAIEGFVDPALSKERGLVVARLTVGELCTRVRRNMRADMDYEDVRDGLGLLLLDSRVAYSYELEMACMALRTLGFEPVMEAIDGSLDGELSCDFDDVMREFSLHPNLHLVLDSAQIRREGIVDMGPES